MKGAIAIERLLATDPRDAGCDETFAVIDQFAESIAGRGDAAARHPGVAVHLSSCPACSRDLQGIVGAADCDLPLPG